jgi:acyl-CoA dehydrogenase
MDEDIESFRHQVRRYVVSTLAPQLEGWRRKGFIPRETWRPFGELGFMAPELSEDYGGSGGSLAYQLVVQDELARAEVPANTAVHTIAAHSSWITVPRRRSALLIVAVRTGDAGGSGVSLIVVETEGLAGFKVGRRLEKLGQHASDTAELFFNGVSVAEDQLLGEVEGHGFRQLMSQLPYERLMIAVPAAAVIERAVELTAEYCRQRQAFGRSIADFQNTRFKLAECATAAHVVRSFVNDCIQRLLDGTLDDEAAYMAKWWCSEQQCMVTDECLQLFGGYGYMVEYPIARLYADSRVQRIYGGTTEIMKDLIARKVFE